MAGTTTRFDRRTLLAGAAAGAGTLALARDPDRAAAAARNAGVRRVPRALDGRFGQGVASGQPGQRAITLWTKVEELPCTSRLELEVSTSADFRRVIERRTVVADARRDFAVQARIASNRLRPGEEYFYRFDTGRRNSPVGRFRTALPLDSRQPVRIGFFSCQDFEAGYYTALDALAAEGDLDCVVCLGDYIYEKGGEDDAVRSDTVGANGDGEVQTLSEYREKYRLYHTDAALRRVRQQHPLIAIWDDHEVENNYAGRLDGGGTRDLRVPFIQRRRNAYGAFFEHMPMVRSRAERDRIYGRLRLGRNADLFLLDARQYRDDQPCGDPTGSSCAEADDPSRTLLGSAQKAWLKSGLAGSSATWKVVGNQVMIMALEAPPRNQLNNDGWDGYRAERRELMEFVRARGIDDVTFITGDIHTFFAGNVTPSGRESALPGDGPSVATEFVGGSITSDGLLGEPPGGSQPGSIRLPPDAGVESTNPHYAYANLSVKGYGVLEARSDELRVEFKGVRTIRSRSSDAFSLARFRVRSGTPDVELLSRAAGHPRTA